MKTKNVIKVRGLASLANLAKSALETAKVAHSQATISHANATAAIKLQQIALELNWPLADLLNWYENDLYEIAGMEIERVRFIVRDYVKIIGLCRHEGYLPIHYEDFTWPQKSK